MSRLTLLLWLLTNLLDCCGQLAFKTAALSSAYCSGTQPWRYMLARPWVWLGVVSYAVQFLLWLAFLSRVALSQAVLLASINVVAIMLAGRWCFNERLTRWRLAGMLLISLGVIIVGLG